MKKLFLFIIPVCLLSCSSDKLSAIPGEEEASLFSAFGDAIYELLFHRDELPKAEYIQYVEDRENRLVTSKVIGDYTYVLQYKPLEYETLRHMSGEKVTRAQFDSTKNSLSDLQYFVFSIQYKEGMQDFIKAHSANYQEYHRLVDYLSFHISKDFMLVDGRDTSYCMLHHWERTFGISPELKMVLAFRAPQNKNEAQKDFSEDKTLVYADALFKTGIIKLTIQKKNLVKCPKLIIKENEII